MFSLEATKTDLRRNPRRPLVTTVEGEDLSRKVHANRFVECSAKENIRIAEAIHEAVRAAVKGPVVVEEKTERKKFSLRTCCQF